MAHKENLIIDAPAIKKAEGAQLSLSAPDYRFHQRFRIHRAGQVFVIKSITGNNFDIKGESTHDRTAIILWHSTGGTNQFWKLEERGKNLFRISSWMNPEIEIGFHRHHVVTSKSDKFLWDIHGYIPGW